MTQTGSYFAVVNTTTQNWNVVHDAARPHAVVEFSSKRAVVLRVISRHASYRGACIKAGKTAKANNRTV